MSKVDQPIKEGAAMLSSPSKKSSKTLYKLQAKLKSTTNLSRSKIIAGVAFSSLFFHSYEAQAFFGTIMTKLGTFTKDFIGLCTAGIVITLIVQITMLAFRKLNNPAHLAWPIGAGVLLTLLDQVRAYFWN